MRRVVTQYATATGSVRICHWFPLWFPPDTKGESDGVKDEREAEVDAARRNPSQEGLRDMERDLMLPEINVDGVTDARTRAALASERALSEAAARQAAEGCAHLRASLDEARKRIETFEESSAEDARTINRWAERCDALREALGSTLGIIAWRWTASPATDEYTMAWREARLAEWRAALTGGHHDRS